MGPYIQSAPWRREQATVWVVLGIIRCFDCIFPAASICDSSTVDSKLSVRSAAWSWLVRNFVGFWLFRYSIWQSCTTSRPSTYSSALNTLFPLCRHACWKPASTSSENCLLLLSFANCSLQNNGCLLILRVFAIFRAPSNMGRFRERLPLSILWSFKCKREKSWDLLHTIFSWINWARPSRSSISRFGTEIFVRYLLHRSTSFQDHYALSVGFQFDDMLVYHLFLEDCPNQVKISDSQLQVSQTCVEEDPTFEIRYCFCLSKIVSAAIHERSASS